MYDGNGNLTSEKEGGKTTSYRYDLLNRQEKVWTSDGREQENLYDGEGLRAGLRENGKKISFLFYNGEILAECDGDGMPVRRHLPGIGLSYMQTLCIMPAVRMNRGVLRISPGKTEKSKIVMFMMPLGMCLRGRKG